MDRLLARLRATSAVFLVAALAAAPAAAQSLTPQQKDEVRAIVRDYIRQHPEVVEEALSELDRRAKAELRRTMENDPRDFSIGPRNAPVTIVEFFDYRCPYCHTAMSWVFDAHRRNPQMVRVVFKEFPVLGPDSVEAAQAAVATIRQGRYQPFHRALMSHRGALNSQAIDAIARRSGVDVARMRRDMTDSAIFNHLEANHKLAGRSQIEGTPAFVINGELVQGGWNRNEADRLLNAALRNARRASR
jgi:protein-disulfide isomerase